MKGATSSVRVSERDLCFVESILDDRSGEMGGWGGGGRGGRLKHWEDKVDIC